ncbi:ABC transporter permease [Pseudorhodoferax sp.]|uniref:ABC transporter permease n=1 Tax=Pseudorhodoferax sp. TaxID=1993553 RepID=UPI002DD66FFA|nr:ABC transporter permease [Pseudorhodoferax sp.]
MLSYLMRRIAYALPIALAVSLVCFLLVHLAPGDPVNAIVSPDAPPEMVQQVREQYGLDRPLPVQFGVWLSHVLRGDFGRSLASGKPVLQEIGPALANTFRLSLVASAIGFAAGCLLGTAAARFRDRWPDKLVIAVSAGGVSVPHYWLGMLLVVVFSVTLNLLPAMGAGSGSQAWAWDWDHLQYLLLPALTLSIIPMGIIARTVRGVVIDIVQQEFVTTLRAKGLARRRVALHVLKNAAPAVLSIMGLQLGYLMGGSILVETVFSWPGTGYLLNGAIFQRDIPLLQGTILLLALIFVALNLVVDLLQALLDPRIQRA